MMSITTIKKAKTANVLMISVNIFHLKQIIQAKQVEETLNGIT